MYSRAESYGSRLPLGLRSADAVPGTRPEYPERSSYSLPRSTPLLCVCGLLSDDHATLPLQSCFFSTRVCNSSALKRSASAFYLPGWSLRLVKSCERHPSETFCLFVSGASSQDFPLFLSFCTHLWCPQQSWVCCLTQKSALFRLT